MNTQTRPMNKIDMAEKAINEVQKIFGVKFRGTDYSPRSITMSANYDELAANSPIIKRLEKHGFYTIKGESTMSFVREQFINVVVTMNNIKKQLTCSISI